jgi:DnaJ-class molecular chaperone
MTQATENRSPAQCAYCGGTGQVNSENCRACGGDGSVLLPEPHRECAHCVGRGKKSAYRCNFCHGTGWAHT